MRKRDVTILKDLKMKHEKPYRGKKCQNKTYQHNQPKLMQHKVKFEENSICGIIDKCERISLCTFIIFATIMSIIGFISAIVIIVYLIMKIL